MLMYRNAKMSIYDCIFIANNSQTCGTHGSFWNLFSIVFQLYREGPISILASTRIQLPLFAFLVIFHAYIACTVFFENFIFQKILSGTH